MTKIEFDEDYDVIDSGSIIHYNITKPIILKIEEEDGTPIKVRFEFKTSNVDSKGVYNGNPIFTQNYINLSEFDYETLLVKVNYIGKANNFGPTEFLDLGTFNGRTLYFNFRIDINEVSDCPMINYTWFVGKYENL